MENVFEENSGVVLTPMQYVALSGMLDEKKLKVRKAENDLRTYRLSEAVHIGDYHVRHDDDEFKQSLREAEDAVSTINYYLSNANIALPSGDKVQVGSLVDVTIDNGMKQFNKCFVVVYQSLNLRDKAIDEVSIESPVALAIYNLEAGNSAEYIVNNRKMSVTVNSVDNNYCANYMEEMSSEFEGLRKRMSL